MSRVRLETACATASATGAVLTVIRRDWIELVLRVDPDRGSGSFEWLLVAGFVALAVLLAVAATRHASATT